MAINHAIILIGGVGSRFCKKKSKQFYKLSGKELIFYAISHFAQSKKISKILLVINKNHEKFIVDFLKKNFGSEFLNGKISCCFGGERRIDSAFYGINFIKNNFYNHGGDSDLNVLIHDGCRPFITQKLINNLINAVAKHDCVLPVLKINEAIKCIDGKKIESKDRDFFYKAQTPQIFKFNSILRCFEENDFSSTNGCFFLNDEAGFLEKYGYSVGFVDGEENNIKVTTKRDLLLAEFFLTL